MEFGRKPRMIRFSKKIEVEPLFVEGYEKFTEFERKDLLQSDCSYKTALKYGAGFDGFDIALLHGVGIKPKDISEDQRKELIVLFKWIGGTLEDVYTRSNKLEKFLPSFLLNFFPNKTLLKKFESLGSGKYGKVVFGEGKAWKFSRDIEKEYNLLKRLKNPKNVIKTKGRVLAGYAIELDYINGTSLERLNFGTNYLPEFRILNFSQDILHGLRELREVGIYHRDLHDRNILISGIDEKAIIIDLGVGTLNPEEIHNDNRAYGGNNDLISTGLLIYKLYTEKNLFNEGNERSCRSFVKDGIKTEREEAYDSPEKLEHYLNKVKSNVRGMMGGYLVSLLNDDLWTQPSLEKVMKAEFDFMKAKKHNLENQKSNFGYLSSDS